MLADKAVGKVAMLVLALVWSLAATGGAAGAWGEELAASATVATGNVDVAFAGVSVVKQQGPGRVSAELLPGGKAFAVTLEDAWRGTKAEIAFTVVNQGTIPVVAEPAVPEADGLAMAVAPPGLVEPGSEGRGALEVEVTADLERGALETGGVVLEFRQWNR